MKKYDNYKNSGVEWLGEIPEHWEVKKVFHYFKAEKGKNAAILTKDYCGKIEGKFPVYRCEDCGSQTRSRKALKRGTVTSNISLGK